MDANKYTRGLLGRTNKYALKVKRHYDTAVNELLKISASENLVEGQVFSFADKKRMSKQATKILRSLYSNVYNEIKGGITNEWATANLANDELIESIFGKGLMDDNHFARWFGRNMESMNAFFARTNAYDGLNLSQRVWQYTGSLKEEMEMALSVSLGEGVSADVASRRVRQYLNDPDKLFRRVKGADGLLHLSKAAKAFHPGRGVYRSSYKNAMRLTRTETNMAYRFSDFERRQNLDFVVGQRIQMSAQHPHVDICDEMEGDYPKTFKFGGWHPLCFCFSTSILATQKEMIAMQKQMMEKGTTDIIPKRQITKMPRGFNKWVKKNIERSKKATSVPYWIRDNFVDGQLAKGLIPIEKKMSVWDIAKIRHANRDEAAIKHAWIEHNAAIRHAKRDDAAVFKAWNTRRSIFKFANKMSVYMDGIADVNVSKLNSLLKNGDYAAMEKEAKVLLAKGKEIKSYTNLADPMAAAKEFSMADAKAVNEAVGKKLQSWVSQNGASSWESLSPQVKLKKLNFEVDWLEHNHVGKSWEKTWKLAQDAYAKQSEIVSTAIEKDAIVGSVQDAMEFAKTTKSKPMKALAAEFDGLAKSGADNSVLKAKSLELEQYYEKLEKARIARIRKKLGDGAFEQIQPITDEEVASLFDEFEKQTSSSVDYIDSKLRGLSKEAWEVLSNEERTVLTKYTQTFSYLNEPLRNIPYYGSLVPNAEHIHDLPILTNALQKFRLTENIVVRRGVSDYGIKELGYGSLEELKMGDVFTDKGFLSTAVHKEKGFFRSYNLIIATPKGSAGFYAEPFSHYTDNGCFKYELNELWNGKTKETIGSELEWIGQRGSRLKVIKKDGNKIYLQLIGQLE